MRRRGHAGFTLIELLVVVAIIGILASIAIANYLNALARARQKRTMADIRTIAIAWEQRNAEKGSYAAAGFSFPTAAVTYGTLDAALTPSYIQKLPPYDGWGRPFEFAVEDRIYAIRSSGRDGIYEGTDYEATAFDNPDCDIVYSNGRFVRWPAEVQQN
ncbi:MAG: type IV pilin protein [Thermoanaerobaculia bacterium]